MVERKSERVMVVVLLAALCISQSYIAATWSPNSDELAHIAAGVALWQYGTYSVYAVNPPLLRAVVAVPAMLAGVEDHWGDFNAAPIDRAEFRLGSQFAEAHVDLWWSYLVAGRLALLPFSVLGAMFCYRWARELYGVRSGIVALTLWCFSPSAWTWCSTICTDGIAASLGVVACYYYWRWLRQQSWSMAGIAGIALGVAQLAKFTWAFLYLLWPGIFIAVVIAARSTRRKSIRCWIQLAAILILSVYVVNLAYLFDGTCAAVSGFTFHSNTLSTVVGEGNYARDSGSVSIWTEYVRVPLPRYYVLGIDTQLADFENGKPSYLFGKWQERGWWYYYLVGLVMKLPLGIWCLGAIASAAGRVTGIPGRPTPEDRLAREQPPARRPVSPHELYALVLALSTIAVVSSQTGFSLHFRYVFPSFPFLFVLVGKSGLWCHISGKAGRACVGIPLTSYVVASVFVFPHSISFFNALAGGPTMGHHFMLSTSHSWSQDTWYVKQWIDIHASEDPPFVDSPLPLQTDMYGIETRGRPYIRDTSVEAEMDIVQKQYIPGPVPGWYVLSVQELRREPGAYSYLKHGRLVARITYSHVVYLIDAEGARRARRELGLSLNDSRRKKVGGGLFLQRDAVGRDGIKVAILEVNGDIGGFEDHISDGKSTLSWARLTCDEIRTKGMSDFDVLLVPGGSSRVQGAELGQVGRERIRAFVNAGGGYLGICAGAALGSVSRETSLNLLNVQPIQGQHNVAPIGIVSKSARGMGEVEIEFTEHGRPIVGSVVGDVLRVRYSSGPLFRDGPRTDMDEHIVLARFRSECFLHDFQRGSMAERPAVVGGRYGVGRVVLVSPHVEQTHEGVDIVRRLIELVSPQ